MNSEPAGVDQERSTQEPPLKQEGPACCACGKELYGNGRAMRCYNHECDAVFLPASIVMAEIEAWNWEHATELANLRVWRVGAEAALTLYEQSLTRTDWMPQGRAEVCACITALANRGALTPEDEQRIADFIAFRARTGQ